MSRPLTHARAAMFMSYIAKSAAAWAGDMLTLPEQAAEPVRAEAMARFVAEIQGKLALLSPEPAPAPVEPQTDFAKQQAAFPYG